MAKGRGSAPSQRQLRVGEELRHVISDILTRGHIRDPDLAGISITVTEVRTSPDLRNATVFVMPLGGEAEARVMAALRRAAPFVRRELARSVTMRYVPALKFEPDLTFAAAEHVDHVLRRPEVARDLDADDGDRPDGDDDGA